MNKQQQWSVIRRLFDNLQNPSKLYTGADIKKLLKTEIFELKKPFNNNPINSNQWSAYCHYSITVSFSNLLDKHGIDSSSTVVIHPLLPPALVDEVIKRGCSMIVADIDLHTLAINKTQLEAALKDHPDLIIHFSDNGLYQEIVDHVTYTNSLRIPVLCIINNPLPCHELLKLFEMIHLGSVLWNFGDSFLDDQLSKVLDNSLPSREWYVSWFNEYRTRSSFEYHLSSSKESVVPLLENYLFLLLKQYEQYGWKEKFLPLAYSLLRTQKITNIEEAKIIISQSLSQVFNSAIPDIIFALELIEPTGMRPNTLGDIDDLEHYIHSMSKNFFTTVRNSEGVEVEQYDEHRIYFKAAVLTKNKNVWIQYFRGKKITLKPFVIHADILKLQHHNLSLLAKQGLTTDFSQFLYT